MLVTDTHAHIYSPDEERYPMVEKPLRPPKGTGTIEHLRREMAANGVKRVVAIQTTTAYGWDNRFLVDSAKANSSWMVGVCTLDPTDPSSPSLLRRYVHEFNVRGLRSYPAEVNTKPSLVGTQTASEPEEIQKHLDHPGVEALWATAEELGITVNVLIRVDMADELETMLRRHPDLRVVLDHCMYPRGKEGLQGETIQRVLYLARYPNLYAKLTWLVDSSDTDYPFTDTYPLLRAVIRAYGPERCVWGSDFPCELWTPKATYAQHLTLFTQALGLSEGEKQEILAYTPGRLWFGEE